MATTKYGRMRTVGYYSPCVFFFLMIPQPPGSTLFPYTTLFRSGKLGFGLVGSYLGYQAQNLLLSESGKAQRREDRKSTRLNSSHSQISYAVFCLKKKSLEMHSDPHARLALAPKPSQLLQSLCSP